MPVATLSKASFCGRSLVGIARSNPAVAWFFLSCVCCVFSGTGLCDRPIPRPEESQHVCVCVCVCVYHRECLRGLLLGCRQAYFFLNIPLIVLCCVNCSISQSSYFCLFCCSSPYQSSFLCSSFYLYTEFYFIAIFASILSFIFSCLFSHFLISTLNFGRQFVRL